MSSASVSWSGWAIVQPLFFFTAKTDREQMIGKTNSIRHFDNSSTVALDFPNASSLESLMRLPLFVQSVRYRRNLKKEFVERGVGLRRAPELTHLHFPKMTQAGGS
jgi:hypothetical protein